MTARALSTANHERLVKLCGLLASNHDGERAAAGLLASRLLRDAGLTWADVIGAQGGKTAPAGGAPAGSYAYHSQDRRVHSLLARPDVLTDWEAGFIASLARRRRWTAKQDAVFQEIWQRVQAATTPDPGGGV